MIGRMRFAGQTPRPGCEDWHVRDSQSSPGQPPVDVTEWVAGHADLSASQQVAGLVLAAGGGRRDGGPQALVRPGGGLLGENARATLRDAGCAPIAAVLGAGAAEVRQTARFSARLIVVDNPDWATGMGSSLRVGWTALKATTAPAAVVLLVDTPGITAAAVARLIECAVTPSRSEQPPSSLDQVLARASYGGIPGPPVLPGRPPWAGVASMGVPDEGARPYLRRHA